VSWKLQVQLNGSAHDGTVVGSGSYGQHSIRRVRRPTHACDGDYPTRPASTGRMHTCGPLKLHMQLQIQRKVIVFLYNKILYTYLIVLVGLYLDCVCSRAHAST
jgi:hypothetical protein